ncbi:ABC transporter substrate-binding protein [Bauldia litoralis]|uniref:Amino acid/amide ABC transporter substrate-binding protein, HAAT family n=1 Tax=Bauldia litoralis TaxID=665467 RepID=A0A1G6DKU5_9HYPH|nr:ABC transporter substrate-binding protein [Bauldia litoralis]SDB45794.1 amino acid/amide ABC transporter substrate-binding protein, HAAT family [Bauldia litoralis]
MTAILKTNRRRCLALIGAVGLALAAPSVALAQDGEPVKMGLLVGLSGDMGPWAPALNNAAILAVEEINADGGILGRPVTLIAEDNNSTVDGAMRGATKLVSVDGVSVIIGPESDPIVALRGYAKDNKIPVISTSGGTEALDDAGGTGTYIYRTNASDSFLGVVHAKMLLDEIKQDEVVLVVENLEGTKSGAETFKRAYERLGGTITKEITLAPGQTSYLSELADVASAEPEMVFLAVGQTAGVNFVKQAYQRGYEWDYWVTAELQSPDFVNAVGAEVAAGAMNPVSSQVEGAKSWERFSDAYEARFGEKPEPGFYQAETYDAFIAVALAMEAAGETTGEAVDANLIKVSGPGGKSVISFADGVAALKAGEEIDYEGASGKLDFDEHGNVTIPATRLLKVSEDGEWETVTIVDSSAFPAN